MVQTNNNGNHVTNQNIIYAPQIVIISGNNQQSNNTGEPAKQAQPTEDKKSPIATKASP